MRTAFIASCLVLTLLPSASAPAAPPASAPADRILTLREQETLVRGWKQARFDTLLPGLMRREGIDMWIVVSREYNDDPVFASLVAPTTFASRRRTILVFHDLGPGKGVERLSVGRFDYDGLFTVVPTADNAQWEGLRTLVEARDPKVIGIDTSDAWAFGDGLTATEKTHLVEALGPRYAARTKSAEGLAVGWLEVKLPEETEAYRGAMRIAHRIIAEAFSTKVITPGVTTDEDVAWWMRQRVAELGLGTWFQPSVDIQRKGGLPKETPARGHVIQPGDVLHCDFGIVYLGFATDTQHMAYVPRPGETGVPAGLVAGLADANRLQDITMRHATAGATGNQALAAALAEAKAEGITPQIYCHPVGFHGHAAGPMIGMTDYQQGVPVRGDYAFHANTWHSIELNARRAVPEWDGQDVRFMLEEDAGLFAQGWSWIDGRRDTYYLIR